jgi:hypothetical protein
MRFQRRRKTVIQKFSTGFGFLFLMLLGFQRAALAANEDTCTAITSVPFTISAPGAYCLTKDIATPSTFTSGAAITVSSNDVTVDLGGHTLANLAAGTGTRAFGIQGIPAGSNLQNVTVRNGTVRGFLEGILLNGPTFSAANSSGHLVEDIRADFNRGAGIDVHGAGSVVRQNQILHTGGSTVTAQIIGLAMVGDGAQVLDNVVVDTVAPAAGTAWGILAEDDLTTATGEMIEGNHVSNVTLTSNSIAIQSGSASNLVVNNRIANFNAGIIIFSTAKYRDNLTINTTTPYTGGTDEGNNK